MVETLELKKSANFLKTLGNQYRLQILRQLMSGEKNVTELNLHVKVSQPALSQHLSKMRIAGIVDFRREQRQIYYYLKNPHVLRVIGLAEEAVAHDNDNKAASSKQKIA
jgi:DNA-binding transcriptional ArsR family regulator